MPLSLFESALGGIGLFLLGMRIMSDGIRTVADDRIRSVFSALTSNRLNSLAFGLILTQFVNSPGAAVILTIGLINGGLLNVFQALNVFAGIMTGAALSLYIPGIPYDLVGTPLIFIGVLLRFFASRRRLSNLGDLLLGSGLLFFGLSLLAGGFTPSVDHPFYGLFHDTFFNGRLPSLFFGVVVSCFVQPADSFAAAVSSLLNSYNMRIGAAGAMTLGGVVGVAAIGYLASLTGITIARRIAAVFLLVSVAVALLLTLLAPSLAGFFPSHERAILSALPMARVAFQPGLSGMYTIASLMTAFLAVLLSGVISRFSGSPADRKIIRKTPQPCAGYLDDRILNTPTLAVEQVRKEITRMMTVASFMFADASDILFDFDARRAETIRRHEQALDALNHEIPAFLAKLARSADNPSISFEVPGFFQMVTDLEHIGDNCEKILDCIIARKEEHILFSDEAMCDLKRLTELVKPGFDLLEESFSQAPVDLRHRLRELKNESHQAFYEIRQAHFQRICGGVCPSRAAMMFNELSSAFERIAELCWNISATQERKTT